MRWISARAVAAAFLVVGAGCGDAGEGTGPRYSADGFWVGRTYGATLSVGLNKEGTRLTGRGSLSSSSELIPFVIHGANERDRVSFILQNKDFLEANFKGKLVSATSIEGVLNGSGFSNDHIVLTKQ